MSLPASRNQRTAPMVLLEWDAPTFSVVRIHCLDDGRFDVAQQFTIKNTDFSTQSVQEQARWLRRQLQSNGISRKNVRVVVPRRFVTTQLLSVPTDDPGELSAICTMQLKGRAGPEQTELAGDYLALPSEATSLIGPVQLSTSSGSVAESKSGTGTDVLGKTESQITTLFLASISRAKVESILAVSREAGLRVAGIHVAEFSPKYRLPPSDSVFGLESDLERENTLSLQVLRREKRIEFIVAAHGIPLAAQTFPFLDDGAEVASVMPALGMRVLQSVGSNAAKQLSEVSLFGQDAGALREHFEEYFRVRIQTPAEQQNTKYPFLALAHAIADETPLFDFANSRIAVQDNKTQSIFWQPYVAAAMVLLMVAVGCANVWQRSELATLNVRLNNLKSAHSSTQTQTAQQACRKLAAWTDQTPDWPKTLATLASCLPDHEIAYLESLRADVDRRNQASIHASGIARSAHDVLELQDELVSHPKFELVPQRVTPTNDDQYRAKFSLHVSPKERP